MRVVEHSGDTLKGVIDGANTTFTASLPMDLDTVGVYLNGRLKVPSLEDGFTLLDQMTIHMREPPEVGDTLQVEYTTGAQSGGASGGIPAPARVHDLAPAPARVSELVPTIGAVRGPEAHCGPCPPSRSS